MSAVKKTYPTMTRPTGYVTVPVSVSDLPMHDYSVLPDTLTEEVTTHLDAHPELPGVILLEGEKIYGMLPRKRMFERLGHRYGVELFLRKPIWELFDKLQPEIFTVHPHARVDDAVYLALDRPASALYEPLVVLSEVHGARLLDFHTLLLAQSQMLNNMNNLFSTLNRIEAAIRQMGDLHERLATILDGLRQVVPYHHAAVLPRDARGIHLSDREIVAYTPIVPVVQNAIYQAVLQHNQPIYLEDVSQTPGWNDLGLGTQVDMRTWMGIPLRGDGLALGILSLGRRTLSPFRRDEMSIAETFGNYISQVLQKSHTS
ncbi:MAG: GAF domain-containing protein [Chloroflexi bacterium]|nr:GAF domain-containing protein [Chloroflexota bacterium]